MRAFAFRFAGLLLCISLAGWLGCGSDDNPLAFGGEGGAGGSENDGGNIDDPGSGGSGGGFGCTTAADCDDGIPCTIDTCALGSCRHAAGPNDGATACGVGRHCEVGKGCVPGIPCATDAQCEQRFADDGCKANIHCEAASATCQFSILDNDGDGHPPIVCGGGDCNDADPSVFPGQVESCNGKDDNCNGVVDDFATCPGGGVCQAGVCGSCPPQFLCSGVCTDFQNDALNCGGCGVRCGAGESCKLGACAPDTSCKSPALFVMQDISGSMADEGRWDAANQGIRAFVEQPASSGLAVGIGYFPLSAPIPSSCTTNADCGAYGPCFLGLCLNTGGSADSCVVADYAKPAVAIAKLPGNASAIATSLGDRTPVGGSTLSIPLQGALQYARGWAQANPTSKAAVVLVSDNLPNICKPPDGISAATQAAQAGLEATPSVKTFVIKMAGADGTDADWNGLAQAGGTGTAHTVKTAAEMQSALVAIRGLVSGCP